MSCSVRDHDQVALRQMHRHSQPVDPDKRLAAVCEVESRHVTEGRDPDSPWLCEARPEVERTTQREAGQDVAKQVQHAVILGTTFIIRPLVRTI